MTMTAPIKNLSTRNGSSGQSSRPSQAANPDCPLFADCHSTLLWLLKQDSAAHAYTTSRLLQRRIEAFMLVRFQALFCTFDEVSK
ncbi:hypothetical protein HHL24_41845 [Paraburkholderia sp. RP-4-7]|uniref:Uncharacterized protein n=1 Tax=Paraburkholderia polaris TaxID=2728848 RepID=A0A848IQ44_9BURK|nr:hypothetical protein [Paraburkholderia polaris]NMM04372.1 hypothetical protein [Paraburkholderia polaris]